MWMEMGNLYIDPFFSVSFFFFFFVSVVLQRIMYTFMSVWSLQTVWRNVYRSYTIYKDRDVTDKKRNFIDIDNNYLLKELR